MLFKLVFLSFIAFYRTSRHRSQNYAKLKDFYHRFIGLYLRLSRLGIVSC